MIFHEKSSLPSFCPCSSIPSRCSFVISFTLGLAWFLISALSLRYVFTSCSTLWNSVGEISPSCIACEMILAILSNLLWASSVIASCFSCFPVKILKDFRVMAVTRERSRLVPLKAIPTGNPTLLGNAVMEIPPVLTVDVIRPVSTIPVIILNHFIFLAICSRTSISLRKYASILDNLFNRYDCGSCGAVGFKSSLSYTLIVYLIAADRMSSR